MDHRRYRELAPERLPVALRGMVECAWRAGVPDRDPGHTQRVLPDGCMDLLLVDDETLVAGPDTAAHLAARRPGSSVTGLRFRPGHLPVLLGVPADGLRDRRVALAELSPRTRRVLEHLPRPDASVPAGTHPSPGRVDLALLVHLAGRLLADPDPRPSAVARPPLPGRALDLLRRGGTASAAADELGCTTRTLHRHCLDTLGYGPATVRRVLRFRTATDLLHAGVAPAEVAARAGYSDQPHLSREVRALAGVSPGALTPPRRPPSAKSGHSTVR
ncbi:MAG: helix-turn-helix domain-containing protein [Pseudonocardia sp.]|nr:helix-turn-helix domain-containing protein [Pseudonocardia sp.]